MLAPPEHPPKPFTDAELLASRDLLMRFAIKLSRNATLAEDLVQETFVRALSHAYSFEPGSKLYAWLITILKHLYYSERRKLREYVELDDMYGGIVEPNQQVRLELHDVVAATAHLRQLERPIMLAALGYSMEQIGECEGIPPATVRSRIFRGRQLLHERTG